MAKLEDDVRRISVLLIQQAEATSDAGAKARLLKRAQDMLASLEIPIQAAIAERTIRRDQIDAA